MRRRAVTECRTLRLFKMCDVDPQTNTDERIEVERLCLSFQDRFEHYGSRFTGFLRSHANALDLDNAGDHVAGLLQRVWPEGVPGSAIISNIALNGHPRWLIRPPAEGPRAASFAAGFWAPAFTAYRKQARLVVDGFEIVPHLPCRPFEFLVSGPIHVDSEDQWMAKADFDRLGALPRHRSYTMDRVSPWGDYLNWRKKLVNIDRIALRYSRIKEHASNPVAAEDRRFFPTRTIGLDRVRTLCSAQGETWHQGESRIHGAHVIDDESRIMWVTRQVVVHVSSPGRLSVTVADATQMLQSWAEHNYASLSLFAGTFSPQHEIKSKDNDQDDSHRASQWLSDVEELVGPESVASTACALIRSSKREIVAHHAWTEVPGVQEALRTAARRGVRCYVLGRQSCLDTWTVRDGKAPGFVYSACPEAQANAAALVVDSSVALKFGNVTLKTPENREAVARIAARVREADVSRLHSSLIREVGADDDSNDERSLFAVFALSGDLDQWVRGAQLIGRKTGDIERTRALIHWAECGASIAGTDGPPGGWFCQARRSWWDAFDRTCQAPPVDLDPLLSIAVRLISPSSILAAYVKHVPLRGIIDDPSSFSRLLQACLQICRRWPDFDPIKRCRTFARALAECLGGPDPGHATAAATDVIDGLALSSVDQQRAYRFVSDAIPRPTNVASFVSWLEAHTILDGHAPESMQARAVRHLTDLKHDLQAAQSQKHRHVSELAKLWSTLQLPETELVAALGEGDNGS